MKDYFSLVSFFFIYCCNSFTYPALANIFRQFFLLQLLQLQFLQSELKMIYIGLEGMTNSVRLGSEAVQAE